MLSIQQMNTERGAGSAKYSITTFCPRQDPQTPRDESWPEEGAHKHPSACRSTGEAHVSQPRSLATLAMLHAPPTASTHTHMHMRQAHLCCPSAVGDEECSKRVEKHGWKKSGGTKPKTYGIASGKILAETVPKKHKNCVCARQSLMWEERR